MALGRNQVAHTENAHRAATLALRKKQIRIHAVVDYDRLHLDTLLNFLPHFVADANHRSRAAIHVLCNPPAPAAEGSSTLLREKCVQPVHRHHKWNAEASAQALGGMTAWQRCVRMDHIKLCKFPGPSSQSPSQNLSRIRKPRIARQ